MRMFFSYEGSARKKQKKKQHEITFSSFPLLILGLDSSERLDVFK